MRIETDDNPPTNMDQPPGQPADQASGKTTRPKIYMSNKTNKVIVVFPNGEIVEVANSPEQSKDDTSAVSKNGQLNREYSIGTGSVTVLRRRNSRKSSLDGPTSGVTSPDSEYASDDLGTEKLPAIDTPEASHVCSVRLRHILRRLEKDDIPKADLLKNLKYAASVLETVYIDETRNLNNNAVANHTPSDPQSMQSSSKVKDQKGNPYSRRLCDEDDELSEVEPDAVPSEVRDWLALTFTRSMSNMKRRGTGKPKFRSVAHAIRAGIMVDRIYRRMSSTVGIHVPPNVLTLLKTLDDYNFNVFTVNEASENHSLKFVGYELLQRYDLITKYKLQTSTLEAFFAQLEQGYSKHGNPYHNLIHGADVAQTVHCVLTQSKLAQWLTDLEVFATIVAALIHDYEHTGTTNNFHIMTISEFALLYNDRSVLENHHISSVFKLLQQGDYNILNGLKSEDFREFRSLVIDMVLATDMSSHFQQIKTMKHLLGMPENIDKAKALALVVHCCDISHPAKELSMHKRWTESLLEEFFRQGDRENELGLPFSPLCDRHNTLVAQSQIGFIDFIVDPSFQVMGDMLDKIMAPLGRHSAFHKLQSNDPITEEAFDKVDRSTSTTSLYDRPETKSPTPVSKFAVFRPWEAHLNSNKQYWKDRASIDDNARRRKATLSEVSNENESDEATTAETPDPAAAQKSQRTKGEKLDTLVKGMSRGTSTTGLLAYGTNLTTDPNTLIQVEVAKPIKRRATELGLPHVAAPKNTVIENMKENEHTPLYRSSSTGRIRAKCELGAPLVRGNARKYSEDEILSDVSDDEINEGLIYGDEDDSVSEDVLHELAEELDGGGSEGVRVHGNIVIRGDISGVRHRDRTLTSDDLKEYGLVCDEDESDAYDQVFDDDHVGDVVNDRKSDVGQDERVVNDVTTDNKTGESPDVITKDRKISDVMTKDRETDDDVTDCVETTNESDDMKVRTIHVKTADTNK